MPGLVRLSLLFLALTSPATWATTAGEPLVVLVSSERGAAYQEAATALLTELERGGVAHQEVLQLSPAELAATSRLTPRLFVALGTDASTALVRYQAKAPVLATLLPRASFERLSHAADSQTLSRFSALYLDQPLSRQLDLVRLALPKARRIGVLWGEESATQEKALESQARARGLTLVGARVGPGEPVFNGLKKIVEEIDLLLALADSRIYNSSTLQNILLTSFRSQVPMLAFSPAYVRAGALLSVYTTPEQIGRQAGLMVLEALQGRELGLSQFPREFRVDVNEHVARTLGLNLDARELAERLRRLERGP